MPKFFKFHETSVCSVTTLRYLLYDWWLERKKVSYISGRRRFLYLYGCQIIQIIENAFRVKPPLITQSQTRVSLTCILWTTQNVCCIGIAVNVTSRFCCRKMHPIRTFFGSKCCSVLKIWCALAQFLCIFGFSWCPHFHIFKLKREIWRPTNFRRYTIF